MPSKTWAPTDNLLAADFNTYFRDQVITICTSGTRPTTSVNGRFIWETDTKRLYVWDTSWKLVAEGFAPPVAFAPVLEQGATVTTTVTYCEQSRTGKLITLSGRLAVTGAGTLGNVVSVSLPFPAANTTDRCIGSMRILDNGTAEHVGNAFLVYSGTAIALVTSAGLIGPGFALASGDVVDFTATYWTA